MVFNNFECFTNIGFKEVCYFSDLFSYVCERSPFFVLLYCVFCYIRPLS
jgi:hypothetical protein